MEVLMRNANMVQVQLANPTDVQVSWLGGTAKLERDKTVNCVSWRVTYRPPMVIIQPLTGCDGIVELRFPDSMDTEVSMMNVGRNCQMLDHVFFNNVNRLTVLPDRVSTGGVDSVISGCISAAEQLRERLNATQDTISNMQRENGVLRSENDALQREKADLEGQIVRGSIPNETLQELRERHNELTNEREVVEQEIQSLTTINRLLENENGMMQAELEGIRLRYERCALAREVITDENLAASEVFNRAKTESIASIERMESALTALTGELDKVRSRFRAAVEGDGYVQIDGEQRQSQEDEADGCDD